jgi:hypothetical protein
MTTPTCVGLAEVSGHRRDSTHEHLWPVRNPEIDAAWVADHDIGGFQVTVDDAFFMSRRKRIGQRTADLDDSLNCDPSWGMIGSSG